MRLSIEINRSLIFALILLAFGGILTAKSGHALYQYNHPLDFCEETFAFPTMGGYVLAKLSDCVTQPLQGTGDASLYAVSEEFDTGLYVYDTYTYPVGEHYIRVLISDRDTKKILNGAVNEPNLIVPVMCTVSAPLSDLNRAWYHNIPDFDTSRVYQTFVLKQTNDRGIRNRLYLGILLAAAGIALAFRSGGIRHIEDFSASKDYFREYRHSHNKVNELHKERAILKEYLKRQYNKRFWALGGLGCILVGTLFCLTAQNLLFMAVGAFLTLFGMQEIWGAFINSNLSLAVSLADMLKLDTLHRRIEDTIAKIEALETLLEDSLS